TDEVLPIEPEHELHQAAARIVRARDVLVGAVDLEDAAARARIEDRIEVDGIEDIQDVDLQHERLVSAHRELLLGVQVEASEDRSGDVDVSLAAVAGENLDAVQAAGRSHVPAGWCA